MQPISFLAVADLYSLIQVNSDTSGSSWRSVFLPIVLLPKVFHLSWIFLMFRVCNAVISGEAALGRHISVFMMIPAAHILMLFPKGSILLSSLLSLNLTLGWVCHNRFLAAMTAHLPGTLSPYFLLTLRDAASLPFLEQLLASQNPGGLELNSRAHPVKSPGSEMTPVRNGGAFRSSNSPSEALSTWMPSQSCSG